MTASGGASMGGGNTPPINSGMGVPARSAGTGSSFTPAPASNPFTQAPSQQQAAALPGMQMASHADLAKQMPETAEGAVNALQLIRDDLKKNKDGIYNRVARDAKKLKDNPAANMFADLGIGDTDLQDADVDPRDRFAAVADNPELFAGTLN